MRLTAATFLAFTALLQACGGDTGGGGDRQSAAGRVGAILPAQGHPEYRELETALRDALKERDQELVIEGAENDAARQVQLVQTFTTEGARAIIVAPLDSTALRGAIEGAGKARIPVFSLGVPVTGAPVTTHVEPDYRAAGAAAATYVSAFLGPRLHAAVLGQLAAHGSRETEMAFRGVIDSVNTRVFVGSAESHGTREGAAAALGALLERDASLDAVLALDPVSAQGVIDGAYAHRRADLVVVAVGTTPELLSAIGEVGPLRAALVPRHDEAARLLAETIATALKDEPVTSSLRIPMRLVTADSVRK